MANRLPLILNNGNYQELVITDTTVLGPINQQFAGLMRTATTPGGALVREWSDTVAATTGNIEIGISYNVAVDPITGVWAGRDVADICWLEKWTDLGGTKEYWYAPTAGAGVVPVWTKTQGFDATTGSITLTGSMYLSEGLVAAAAYVGAYTDGMIVDYVTGNGRISAGPADSITFYNGGIGTTQLAQLSSTGLNVTNTVTSAGYIASASVLNNQINTTYTVLAADNGKVITLNNAAAITVTIPAGLGAGFSCMFIQLGLGQVAFVASGTTINSYGSLTHMAGQNAGASIIATAADVFNLSGNLA